MDSSPKSSTSHPQQPSLADDLNEAFDVFRLLWEWRVGLCLIIGFCFVAFAQSLGIALVKEDNGFWDPQKALQTAATLRTLGLMLFGAGLLERMLQFFGGLVASLNTSKTENPRA